MCDNNGQAGWEEWFSEKDTEAKSYAASIRLGKYGKPVNNYYYVNGEICSQEIWYTPDGWKTCFGLDSGIYKPTKEEAIVNYLIKQHIKTFNEEQQIDKNVLILRLREALDL